jgi:hypothetical protein
MYTTFQLQNFLGQLNVNQNKRILQKEDVYLWTEFSCTIEWQAFVNAAMEMVLTVPRRVQNYTAS